MIERKLITAAAGAFAGALTGGIVVAQFSLLIAVAMAVLAVIPVLFFVTGWEMINGPESPRST